MLREYTTDIPVEVNDWVYYIQSIVSKYYVQSAPPPESVVGDDPHMAQTRVFRRLPEIP